MIKNIQVQALIHNEMYQFETCTPVYLDLLLYYAELYDSGSYEKRIEVQEHHWLLARQDIYSASFWWSMNEGLESFFKPNPELPIHWLAHSKRALQWDYMPSNFHSWALAILESFDLPRYQAAYHLPLDELTAIEQDLSVVLEGLRNYPKENLAEPMDEDNWGLVDQ